MVYLAGWSYRLIKLLSSLTLAECPRPGEMDHASLLRYLNKLIFFPVALLGPNLSWEAINDSSAQVTIT